MENSNEKFLNYKLHAQELNWELPEGYVEKEQNNPQVVKVAQASVGILFQAANDGALLLGESFEDRIKKVIDKTVDYMKKSNCSHPDKNYFYFKDYTNGTFNFKLYVQDLVSGGRVIRMLNAFFLEPRHNEFYQISFSVGPFPFPTKILKVGEISKKPDPISSLLISHTEFVLSRLSYK